MKLNKRRSNQTWNMDIISMYVLAASTLSDILLSDNRLTLQGHKRHIPQDHLLIPSYVTRYNVPLLMSSTCKCWLCPRTTHSFLCLKPSLLKGWPEVWLFSLRCSCLAFVLIDTFRNPSAIPSTARESELMKTAKNQQDRQHASNKHPTDNS